MQPTPSPENLQPSVGALESVAQHLKSFGPDQRGFIRYALPKTQLKTALIEHFGKIDDHLQNTYNPALGKRFDAAKNQMIRHIQHRITQVKSLPKTDRLSLQMENAHYYIEDVLFATKIVSKHVLDVLPLESQAEEIRLLRKEALPTFEQILVTKNGVSITEAHQLLHPLRTHLLALERLARKGAPYSAVETETEVIEKIAHDIFASNLHK